MICPFYKAELWKYAKDGEFEENHTNNCIFSPLNPYKKLEGERHPMDKFKLDHTRIIRLCSLLTEEPFIGQKLYKNEDFQYLMTQGKYIWEKFINWDRITIINKHKETEPSVLWRINPQWKLNLTNFIDEPVTSTKINDLIRYQANLD